MFKIGEFSKMSKTPIKTLRYYDEIDLLKPERTDSFTAYRLYGTQQLIVLNKIRSMRQMGLSIDDIKRILSDGESGGVLEKRKKEILLQIDECEKQLSRIEFVLSGQEDYFMNYQATIKQTPQCIVYSARMVLSDYSEYSNVIPKIGAKVAAKYPDLKCTKPEYCFNVYLDSEYREKDINVEFCEAVTELKPDFEDIHFKQLPSVTVVSIYHKGSYAQLTDAYTFIYRWIEDNGYQPTGGARESYIDGVWNKESEDEWLTEIQVPITSQAEIKEKYGNTEQYKQSQSKNFSQQELQREADKIFAQFAQIRTQSPDSPQAMQLVEQWQKYITKYYYDCSREILACLGQMYISDDRFRENIDRCGVGTAQFMSAAIENYCAKEGFI